MTRSAGGSAAGADAGVDLLAPARPRRRSRRGRGPTVGAVVALAGQHDDPAAVGTAEQVERVVGHRRAGSFDQHVDRVGRRGVDRGHLVRA